MSTASCNHQPVFDLKSKPDISLPTAYAAAGSEILGGPDWVRSKNYDLSKLELQIMEALWGHGKA